MAESATLRRRLTAELKRLRSQAKLTQRQVAENLDWSPSKVIRIEQGLVRIGVTDLQALLALYGVSDQETLTELAEMARGSKKLPFADYRDVVSPEALRYFAYEASASIIRELTLYVIPGLLQTEEYSQALFEATGVDRSRADKLAESRKERCELFDRPEPPEAFFILDETVLRRPVGGSRTMARQIDHLVAMSKHPRVSIQVLPFALGTHAGLTGPFVHLEFPAEDDPDVIFVENPLGDTLSRDEPEVTATFRERFWELEDVATPRDTFEKFTRS